MSTQFYTRYVPPSKAVVATAPPIDKPKDPTKLLQKRKRTREDNAEGSSVRDKDGDHKCKKKRISEVQAGEEVPMKEKKGKSKRVKKTSGGHGKDTVAGKADDKQEQKQKRAEKQILDHSAGRETLESGAVEEADEKSKKENRKKQSKEDHVKLGMAERIERMEDQDEDEISGNTAQEEIATHANVTETPPKDSKKKKKTKSMAEDVPSGHSLILQKLRRSLSIAATKKTVEPTELAEPVEDEAAPVEAAGLQPLPQPEPTKPSKPVSAILSLPLWLQEPVTVAPNTTTPFSNISGLSRKLQQRLASLSFPDAFAVQTAVLPLLLDSKGSDLCISAATGSGKTLSYVLPVIQSLSTRIVTRLRAIIVVPTRELVQQVNSTVISLSSGTGLKIGTAIGSRSLAAEQGLLVSNQDGEVTSKVDILITTPGRLVEHVRATLGFELGWVKWLIIDEADRLLAQSFQEWVDVVIVGLEKAVAGNQLSKVAGVDLRDLGLRPGRREAEKVKKVVLSATMTRDVGKLAGLRLRKPAMVVVEEPSPLSGNIDPEGAGVGVEGEEMEQFSVPMGLREHVTPVENIEYKPLFLMYLLRSKSITTGALVFVKSNEGAARLAKLVETVGATTESSWKVGLVTGEMEKKRREKVLKRFQKGDVELYVLLLEWLERLLIASTSD
jgi:ATP-dependent RNA helicase DDX51/DBP6